MKQRCLIASILAMAMIAAGAPAASAAGSGHLDSTFGDDGVVDLKEEALRGSMWLRGMEVAPDGGSYFTTHYPVCGRGGCPYSLSLSRLKADGTLDPRWGPAGVQVGRYRSGAPIAVDSEGQALVAWGRNVEAGFSIRRYLPDGAVDRSFGYEGTVSVSCGCSPDTITVLPGGGVLIGGSTYGRRRDGGLSARWFFTRLSPDGGRKRSFGRGGRTFLPMPDHSAPSEVVPLPRGRVLLGGQRWRGYEAPAPYVFKMTSRGDLDRPFAKATRRSLKGLPQTGRDSYGWEYLRLIPGRGGRIEVFGLSGFWPGLATRLLADGRRDRSYGRDGVVTELPFALSDATSDGEGGTFIVGYRKGGYSVRRMKPDGSLDRRFGRVALPGAYNEEGLQLFAAGRGKAVVLARGEQTCRNSCPSEPKLYRVVSD